MSKAIFFLAIFLGLLIIPVEATTVAPTTYGVGYKLWGSYWDCLWQTCIVDGTLVNITIIGGNSSVQANLSGSYSYNANNLTNLQVVYQQSLLGANGTKTNFTTNNSLLANSSNVWLNGSHLTWVTAYTEWSNGIDFVVAPGGGSSIDIQYTGS